MKHALITGIGGFAGSHLAIQLVTSGWRVTGADHSYSVQQWGTKFAGEPFLQMEKALRQIPVRTGDLNEAGAVEELLDDRSITHIFHLAGLAFVPASWDDPARAFQSNTEIVARLLHYLKQNKSESRLLHISSADLYKMPEQGLAITEESPLDMSTPYAISKMAAEEMIVLYAKHGVNALIARPFNHIGPGQKGNFAVPAFFQRIQKARETGSNSIRVGDLESVRDFSDVRDVASAYERLALSGIAGEIYNVCSGFPVKIADLLQKIMRTMGMELAVEVDPSLFRTEGPSHRWGSAEKLKKLGWVPQYTLDDALQSTYDWMVNLRKHVPEAHRNPGEPTSDGF